METKTHRAVRDDPKVAIAVAGSRFAKRWTNREMPYSELAKRLTVTTRTRETIAEYQRLPKQEKDKIKDVGGFVGGSLKAGRRKAENVANRSLITLDLDSVNTTTQDVWDTITMFYDWDCVVYSTHSHTAKNPRLRLVIPLARPVLPDEYQAIARKIADGIGIDMFDDTTYEPSRLMYWPSTASDGEFINKHQTGDWLDPDAVLDQYLDWRDQAFWPTSSRQEVRISRLIKKQEDPHEKKGIIGAFCRTYPISQLLETQLKEVYAPASEDQSRYTYVDGSTVGGLVVYEDKFAYSHHGTDPTSGMLCNAFDLYRIHKFGVLDEDVAPETPINRHPSYKRMQELAAEDPAVKRTLGKERLQEVEDEFSFGDSEPDEEAWLQELRYDKKGDVEATIDNVYLILSHDPRVAGKVVYDEFANRIVVVGDLPWRHSESRDWTDTDDSGLRHFLESRYRVTGASKIEDARNMVFESHKVHPVREYLMELAWDGVERIDSLLIDYLGAEDSLYTREATRLHILASVARILEPGTKYDNMLILKGPQGSLKSTFIRKLCGDAWFTDSLETVKGKEAAELLQGFWHVEMGELNATRKAEREAIKLFLSKTEDTYRMPYGRNTSRFKRQCVFWGSTNEDDFLRDPTGDRRHHPVATSVTERTKRVYGDLEKERDQIWAEAVAKWHRGYKLELSDASKEILREVHREFREENPKKGLIVEYLEMQYPDTWEDMDLMERREYLADPEGFSHGGGFIPRDRVCVAEIWCELFGKKPGDIKPQDSREISDILKTIDGWEKKSTSRFGYLYGRQRGYARKVSTDLR